MSNKALYIYIVRSLVTIEFRANFILGCELQLGLESDLMLR